MSTIVAVLKNDIACIAADSLTSFGNTRQPADFVTDSDKIMILKGATPTYMGIVGSAAHPLVMQSLITQYADKIDFSNRISIFNTLKTIHPILKEEYFLNSKEEEGDSYESSRVDALIMNINGIFGLYSLREVDQYARFWAVGSGSEFALGAMHAAYHQLDTAAQIAQVGVEAGATFDAGSAMPMSSYSMRIQS